MERSTPPELDPNLKGLADVLVDILVRRLLAEITEESESDSKDDDDKSIRRRSER